MVNRLWLTKFLVAPFFIGSILLVPGCAAEPSVYANPDKAIVVAPGKEFVIDLESNPTTGYSWQETHDEMIVRLTGKTYEQSVTGTPVVGGGGVESFRFQALKSGTTEIEFFYKRAWEEEPIKETKFHVIVE